MSNNVVSEWLQQLADEEANVATAEEEVKLLQDLFERRKRRVAALRNLVEVLKANPVEPETFDSE